MLDRAGAIQNNVANLGPEANCLRFEISSGRLEWSRWNKPETRVVSEFCRQWRVEDGLLFVDVIGLGDDVAPDSTATAISSTDFNALEDLTIDIKGTSHLTGSVGARSLNLHADNEGVAESVQLEGQDIIVYARGNARINLASVKAHQVLFMLEGGASIEVEEMNCNLIQVRHHGDGLLRIKSASAEMNDGRTVLAAVGRLDRIEIPRNLLVVEEKVAQKFWDDLTRPQQK